MRFAVCGLGFISDRHITAIEDVGGQFVVGCDIDETKKVKLADNVKFETDYKKLINYDLDYVAICTPNYLHYEMTRFFVDNGIRVICEKPFCLDPEYCHEFGDFVNVVHQLRYDKALQAIKKTYSKGKKHKVELKMLIHRDQNYWDSWKGVMIQSGGLLLNIGIHYFDLLRWIFGEYVSTVNATIITPNGHKAQGQFFLERADVSWEIDLDQPLDNQVRKLIIDGESINLGKNMERLHTDVYSEVLAGKGIHPMDIYKSLELVKKLYE